jgi:hypothetical protein
MAYYCIPSYHRANLLPVRTLAFLERHGVQREHIHIYVVEEDLTAYQETCFGYNIHVGVKGLVAQREFIYNSWPEGSWIVFCDDDVQDVIGMDRKPVKNLGELCATGFLTCIKNNLRLWGFNSMCNPFYMKDTVTTHLLFIVGAMFGIVKKGSILSPPIEFKEDVYRTCAYYQADGGVVRINSAGVKTTYYKGSGGLNENRTLEKEKNDVDIVCSAFPLYAKKWTRKDGRVEVRLRHKKLIR